jgi:two-component system, NtrC family, nitrogen regulation sensor histidine kinase NtrY
VSFRFRLQVGAALVALVPVLGVALGVRHEAGARVEAAVARGVESELAGMRGTLAAGAAGITRRLDAVAATLDRDPGIRAALQGDPRARATLLDALPPLAAAGGLDLLRLQDPGGRILASGHFRNEFDRVEAPPLSPTGVGAGMREVRGGGAVVGTAAAGAPPGVVLVTPSASGPLEVLAVVRPLELAGRPFLLVGGVALEGLGVPPALAAPEEAGRPLPQEGPGVSGSHPRVEWAPRPRSLVLPRLDATRDPPLWDEVHLEVRGPLDEVVALRRSVDRWILLGMAAVLVGVLGLGGWMGARLSRPLEALAARATRIDLDHPDWGPPPARRDELGALARVLARMTQRLGDDAVRLREAERKATVADLARQVHHDIRNGLVPIRNVVRHLVRVRDEDPEALAGVLAQRQRTLEESLTYLDSLAGGWARMAGNPRRVRVEVGPVVEAVAGGAAPPGGVEVRALVSADLPPVFGDPDGVRRIVENLVRNAVEAVGAGPGRVEVTVDAVAGSLEGERDLRVQVTDTGPGLPPGREADVFQDFYTTREGGTGLGLSIVRRLVMDLGGSVEADSPPGGGARFTVLLPPSGGAE